MSSMASVMWSPHVMAAQPKRRFAAALGKRANACSGAACRAATLAAAATKSRREKLRRCESLKQFLKARCSRFESYSGAGGCSYLDHQTRSSSNKRKGLLTSRSTGLSDQVPELEAEEPSELVHPGLVGLGDNLPERGGRRVDCRCTVDRVVQNIHSLGAKLEGSELKHSELTL